MGSIGEEWEVQPLEPDDTHPNERVVISSEGGEVCEVKLGSLAPKAVEKMHLHAHRIAALPDLWRALNKIRLLTMDADLLEPIYKLADEALKRGALPDGLRASTDD